MPLYVYEVVLPDGTAGETFEVLQGMSEPPLTAHPETGEPPDLLREGLALVGSVDSVTHQLERLLARLPARWLFAWTYNGLIPHPKLMRSIELFATRVLPRVADAGFSAESAS